MGFLKKRPFLFDLEDAKRNAGKDVIAVSEAAPLQLIWQSGSVSMNHMHSRIIPQIVASNLARMPRPAQQKQMRVRGHPPRDLTRMHAFTRAVFGNYPWLTEIHFTRDTFDQRF